jgi:PmbA protein
VICSSQWDFNYESMRLINSLGLDCSFSDRTVDGSISAELVRGEDFLNIWQSRSERETFDPHLLTAPILQHLQWSDRHSAACNGKVPILFTSKAADTLWGIVSEACSGRHVRQKTTPWLDKLNQLVISEAITLSQNPTLGIHSLPFDDEGTLTQEFTWIDQGRLKGFYGDRRTAAELNLNLTGNGFRSGLGSYPSPSMFNLIVNNGSGELSDLISSISDGILIDQILGDTPDLSGDFSINIDLGYRIKQGKIIGRVKDTMVSGNAYTALNHLVQLGGDRTWQGSLYTPSLIVDGLSVTSRS